MKYNKILKNGVLSLLLAGSLACTEMPVRAADLTDGNAPWEDSGEFTDGDSEETSLENEDLSSDTEEFLSDESEDGFSDGEIQEQTAGFGSLDQENPSPENENSGEENSLTEAELEAQLEPIRELEP